MSENTAKSNSPEEPLPFGNLVRWMVRGEQTIAALLLLSS